MSKHIICHAHCPKDGGGGAAIALVLAVIVIASIAGPVVNAAIGVLEVALIAAGSVAVLAAIGGIAYVALRARGRQARDLQGMSRQVLIVHRPPGSLSAPRRQAIEAPRPVVDGLAAHQVSSDETRERR